MRIFGQAGGLAGRWAGRQIGEQKSEQGCCGRFKHQPKAMRRIAWRVGGLQVVIRGSSICVEFERLQGVL
jgi:hypothetical protein